MTVQQSIPTMEECSFGLCPAIDCTEPEVKECADELNRIMANIVHRVKRLSGKRTEDKYPYFIGQQLTNLADRGEANLFYGNDVSPLQVYEL